MSFQADVSPERQRLLRDPSTDPAVLLRYAERHQDPLVRAIALARAGDTATWSQICALAEVLDGDGLARLDQALEAWPHAQRRVPGLWWPPEGEIRSEVAIARSLVFEPPRTLSFWDIMEHNAYDEDEDTYEGIPLHEHPRYVSSEDDDEGGLRAGVVDIEALTQAPALGHIRHLNLAHQPLDKEGAVLLAQCAGMQRIEVLDLRYTLINDAALSALAASPHLEHLAALHLQRNAIGSAGIRSLASSPRLENVHTLDLRYNAIGEEGARALAASPYVSRLTALYLYLDDIGREGAQALASSTMLPAPIQRYWRGLL